MVELIQVRVSIGVKGWLLVALVFIIVDWLALSLLLKSYLTFNLRAEEFFVPAVVHLATMAFLDEVFIVAATLSLQVY